jgi:lipopolysaccharide transport system ATP-binding protein
LKPPVPGFVLYNEIGAPVFGSNPRIHSEEFHGKESKEGIVSVSVKNISLYSGYYSISVWLGDFDTNYDYQDSAINFNYLSANNYSANPSPVTVGSVDPAAKWSINSFE